MLPLYLLVALTGLWWSYDVYRDAINRAAGVTSPQRRPDGSARVDLPSAAVDAAWTTFRREVAGATRATIPLAGDAGAPIEIRYQTRESPHGRAWNTLKVDATGAAVVANERYAGQPAGRRFVSSLFPLHSGDFFGLPGRIAMALAALALPLFTLTGLWMWQQRRRAERARANRAAPIANETPALDRP